MECPEAAALGTAVMQAAAVGVYPDIPTAVRAMVRLSSRTEPEAADVAPCETAYRRFDSLSRAALAQPK